MNGNELKVIEMLADKLGTTSAFLWELLLRQAPLDATWRLLYLIFTLTLWFPLYKLHKEFANAENEFNYYDHEPGPHAVIGSLGIFLTIVTIIVISNVDKIYYGFVIPEFWAIDYLLSHLKN